MSCFLFPCILSLEKIMMLEILLLYRFYYEYTTLNYFSKFITNQIKKGTNITMPFMRSQKYIMTNDKF